MGVFKSIQILWKNWYFWPFFFDRMASRLEAFQQRKVEKS